MPAYGRHSDNLETSVIQLYTKGITTAEIAELIEKMYGAHYSKATVSNMTKAVNEQVQAFQQRRLASQYAAIFLDATYLPLKRDTVKAGYRSKRSRSYCDWHSSRWYERSAELPSGANGIDWHLD